MSMDLLNQIGNRSICCKSNKLFLKNNFYISLFLLLAQLFATIAYGVIFSSTVLYAVKTLHIGDKSASDILISFSALNFLLHMVGGYIADRYISSRLLFVTSMIFQAIGCLVLMLQTTHYLYLGLAVFLLGSGICYICILCILGNFFKTNERKRHNAFILNYCGMNIGFFLGYFLSGYFTLFGNFAQLFLISAIASILALIVLLFIWRQIKITSLTATFKSTFIYYVTVFPILFITTFLLLKYTALCNMLVLAAGILTLGTILYVSNLNRYVEIKYNLRLFFILACASIIFWIIYFLSPSCFMLFLDRNVDRHAQGIIIPPQWLQNTRILLLLIAGPLITGFLSNINKSRMKFTVPAQFSLGLGLTGLGLIVLPIGIYFADSNGLISIGWIIASNTLQSLGEIFICPVGFSIAGQLAPPKLHNFMTGAWLLLVGFSANISGYFNHLALINVGSIQPIATNPHYSNIFMMLGIIALAGCFLIFIALPKLNSILSSGYGLNLRG